MVGELAPVANGFLPTRGSWMLDFVALAMVAVVIALTYSIYQVRARRNFRLHRAIQIATAVVLTVVVVAFEIDVRFFTDWRELARPSPFYESGAVYWLLFVHLCFAIPTPFVWGVTIWMALRRFKTGFEQGDFNRFHRTCGWIAAGMMFATAITGWIFYYVAFVA